MIMLVGHIPVMDLTMFSVGDQAATICGAVLPQLQAANKVGRWSGQNQLLGLLFTAWSSFRDYIQCGAIYNTKHPNYVVCQGL